jgi:hypothetical protein
MKTIGYNEDETAKVMISDAQQLQKGFNGSRCLQLTSTACCLGEVLYRDCVRDTQGD